MKCEFHCDSYNDLPDLAPLRLVAAYLQSELLVVCIVHLPKLVILLPGDPNFGNCSCFSGGNGQCQVCTGHCGVPAHYHARKRVVEVGYVMMRTVLWICPAFYKAGRFTLLAVIS